MSDLYILASSKVWIPDLAERLQQKLQQRFSCFARKEQLELDALRQLRPRKIFFTHWSYLIPEEIFSEFECVVFHMTDLPFGRGGSPLQNLIARGVRSTCVSALRCVKDIDAGPVYLKSEPIDISRGSAGAIFQKVAQVVETMIEKIVRENPSPIPQQGEVVLFKRRKPEDSRVPEALSAEKLYDFIRMLDAPGYPPAYIDVGDWRLELTQSELEGEGVKAQVIFKEKNS